MHNCGNSSLKTTNCGKSSLKTTEVQVDEAWKTGGERGVCIFELDCLGFNPGPICWVALEKLQSFSQH